MKKAFTLAETLITLGIIGVVATLTLPNLMANYKDKVMTAKLKNVYNTLSNAMDLAVLDYGTVDEWGLANTVKDNSDPENPNVYTQGTLDSNDLFFDILTKYMKVVSRCTYNNCGKNKPDGDGAYVKLNDGNMIHGFFIHDATCSSTRGTVKNQCGDIYIATSPKPTRGDTWTNGLDYWTFWITKDGIVPCGTDGDSRSFANSCLEGRHDGCAAWVIENGNMDYRKCPDKVGWDKASSCNE